MMKQKKSNKLVINYILIIVGALLTYYGYLSEGSQNFYKIIIPLVAGWSLFIIGLVRLK